MSDTERRDEARAKPLLTALASLIQIPKWFAPPPAKGKAKAPLTVAEIEAQLLEADADVAAVEQRENAAAEREAHERTPAAVEAFEAVRVEADRLRRFRERLGADLEQAREREAAERRAALQVEYEAQRSKTGELTQQVPGLIREEIEALVAVLDVRVRRRALWRALSRQRDLEFQALRMVQPNTEPPVYRHSDFPEHYPVKHALEQRISTREEQILLSKLLPNEGDYLAPNPDEPPAQRW